MIRFATATGAVLLAAACHPVRVQPPPSPVPAPLPGAAVAFSFTLQPDSAPVISSGRAGLPILPADPNIYIDAEGYHLFSSTLFCRRNGRYVYSWDPANPYGCDISKVITTIAYAFSADRGLTWTFRPSPVILPPDTGFDSYRIETASVFRVGDVLYLGYSGDGDFKGRRFDNSVQELSITRGPDGLVLYYIGLGFGLPNEPVQAPGQSIERVQLGRALLDDSLNVISRSEAPILDGVNIPEVHYFGGAYHLFAATMTGRQRGEAIIHATSPDGVAWNKPEIILTHGNVAGFNEWGLRAPTVAVESNRILLFHTGIGIEPHRCFPVPAQGRWGVPWQDNKMCIFLTVA